MRCPHRNNDERNGVSNDDQQKTLISNFMNDGISPLPIHIAKIVICGKCKTSNRNLERSLKWAEGLFTICVCIIRLSFFTHIVNVIKVLLLYLFPLACPAAYLFNFSFGDSHSQLTTNIRFSDQSWILFILHSS